MYRYKCKMKNEKCEMIFLSSLFLYLFLFPFFLPTLLPQNEGAHTHVRKKLNIKNAPKGFL